MPPPEEHHDFSEYTFRTGLSYGLVFAGTGIAAGIGALHGDFRQWILLGFVGGGVAAGIASFAYQKYLQSCAEEGDATNEEKS